MSRILTGDQSFEGYEMAEEESGPMGSDPKHTLRRVGRNAMARVGALITARLLSMAQMALVGRYEGAAGLGRYLLVLTAISIVMALTDLGLNTYVVREVARSATDEQQRELLGIALPMKTALALMGILGLVIVANLAPLPEGAEAPMVIGSLALLPEAVLGTMRAFLHGCQRMDVSAYLDTGTRLVALLASLIALAAGFGVPGVLVGGLVASLLGVALYGGVLWHWRKLQAWHHSPHDWRATLVASYPFAVTGLVAMAYARIDLLLVGIWHGDAAAGWYGAAYKLWEAMGLLPASLLDAVFPELSRVSVTSEGIRWVRRLFRSALLASIAGGFVLSGFGLAASNNLIALVYGHGEGYGPAVAPFRILVCAIPAMFIYLLGGHTLYALEKQRRVSVVMLAVGCLNIAGNAVAIPRWGYLGAAVVALCTDWILAAILYGQARSVLNTSARA